MHRRTFVQTTTAAALGSLLMPGMGCRSAETDDGGSILPVAVGLQLYTVRELLEQDFYGTLEAIAGIGYEELEFAGLHEHAPEDVREHLETLGLRAPAAHYQLQRLEDDFQGVVEEAQTLDHSYIVVPWLAEEQRQSLDDYRRVAQTFNDLGERLQAEGLQFGYHNHAFEFERFNGVPGYDVLLEETNPELVVMELDLYWVVEGGEDPLEYLERYPGRFPLFHVKDRTEDGEMVDVGDGDIPFEAIFQRAERDGLAHAFVEHDNPADPMATVEASYHHLTGQ